MSNTWSHHLEQRYALQLPSDLRAWLDSGLWHQQGGAEFHRASTPEQLLDPEPGLIWAGFMLPDTLPLIGNDYGDWLCARVTASGAVAEILHWSHCGGDWIPYGNSLGEALLYDLAARFLHPGRPELNAPAIPDQAEFHWAEWASPWLPGAGAAVELLRSGAESGRVDGGRVLELFGAQKIAQSVISRDRILRFLDSPLKALSDVAVSQGLGVPWEPDFVRWLFDNRLLEHSIRRSLADYFQVPEDQLVAQDWDAAEREAQVVLARRADLGWAFDVAGWAAERRGDWQQAIGHYLAGVRTSLFSDHAISFRSHWFDEGYGKFAAARLADLRPRLTREQRALPYLKLFWENDATTLRTRVRQYWLRKAHEDLRVEDFHGAYQHFYRAGWDLGLNLIDAYGEILEGLCTAARGIGSTALTRLSQLHHRFLV